MRNLSYVCNPDCPKRGEWDVSHKPNITLANGYTIVSYPGLHTCVPLHKSEKRYTLVWGLVLNIEIVSECSRT